MPIATDSAAPALTPSSPGSASGLRVSAWINAPEAPRAVPTSSPAIVRGRRRSRTIWCSLEPSNAVNASKTVQRGIGLAPTATLITDSMPSTRIATAKQRVRDARLPTRPLLFGFCRDTVGREPREGLIAHRNPRPETLVRSSPRMTWDHA